MSATRTHRERTAWFGGVLALGAMAMLFAALLFGCLYLRARAETIAAADAFTRAVIGLGAALWIASALSLGGEEGPEAEPSDAQAADGWAASVQTDDRARVRSGRAASGARRWLTLATGAGALGAEGWGLTRLSSVVARSGSEGALLFTTGLVHLAFAVGAALALGISRRARPSLATEAWRLAAVVWLGFSLAVVWR